MHAETTVYDTSGFTSSIIISLSLQLSLQSLTCRSNNKRVWLTTNQWLIVVIHYSRESSPDKNELHQSTRYYAIAATVWTLGGCGVRCSSAREFCVKWYWCTYISVPFFCYGKMEGILIGILFRQKEVLQYVQKSIRICYGPFDVPGHLLQWNRIKMWHVFSIRAVRPRSQDGRPCACRWHSG